MSGTQFGHHSKQNVHAREEMQPLPKARGKDVTCAKWEKRQILIVCFDAHD